MSETLESEVRLQIKEIGSPENSEIDVVACQNEVVLDPFIQCLALVGPIEE